MAATETFGVMGYVDEDGNQNIHYPITQAELALYDNSTSGLEADNAQAAIDELSAAKVLTGHGAPTAATVGKIGQHYIDLDAPAEYTCLGIKEDSGAKTYTWAVGGGGGGSSLKLNRIYIDTQPTKTAYKAGEAFDPTGMVVKADYALDGVVIVKGTEVTGYSYPTEALSAADTGVTITYSEGGVIQTAQQEISVSKLTPTITPDQTSVTLDPEHLTAHVELTTDSDGALSVETSDSSIATATISGNTVTISHVNETSGAAAVTIRQEEGANYAAGSIEIPVTAQFTTIYGVQWDGTSTPVLTRTDAAASFTDPVPYVAGAASYGSPFDNLAPWKNMEKVTDSEAGAMVKIPKFWYKLTQSGNTLKIQIADGEVDGFSVCPACMNRGDGKGERDYVLVGRYHCAASTYKSTTGVKPQVSMKQADFRTNIHNLGSNVYMMDFATRFTIWLLYIVEFANWNSQATIGKGCGNNSAVENMGYTDSMPYHTGTMLSSRDTYGVGTQYRWLEGLWDNCYDRLTGCYNASTGLMVEVNPANFAENSGGVSVGTPANGWIAGLTVSTSGPFPCFINSKTDGGGEAAYVCDYWYFYASYPVVVVGGSYYQSGYHGLFHVSYTALTVTSANYGSRVLKFP